MVKISSTDFKHQLVGMCPTLRCRLYAAYGVRIQRLCDVPRQLLSFLVFLAKASCLWNCMATACCAAIVLQVSQTLQLAFAYSLHAQHWTDVLIRWLQQVSAGLLSQQ